MKRILLIGAVILGVVVLVGATVLYLQRDKILTYTMDRALSKVETQVVRNWGDSRTTAEVQKDFTMLHERLQAGTVKAEAVKQLAAMFYSSYQDEKLDSLEVRRLADKVHQLVTAN